MRTKGQHSIQSENTGPTFQSTSGLLDRALADFASLIASEEYNLQIDSFAPGLLEHLDLPDLCSALAPRHLSIQNPVAPNRAVLALSTARERYGYTINAYENLHVPIASR